MPVKRKFWLILGALALTAAAALALTSPKEDARLRSARRPAAETSAARTGTTARQGAPAPASNAEGARASAAVAGSGGERSPETSADGARPAPALALTESGNNPAEAAHANARPSEPGATVRLASGEAARRNLFRPLVATSTPGALGNASLPPWLPGLDDILPIPDGDALTGKRQRAYWEYVGTVHLAGVTYALVEEKKSKAGVYLKIGDSFRGGQVEIVQPGYLVVSLEGRRYTLPKSTGMTNTSAEALAGAAAAPASAPAAPGQTPPSGGSPQPGGGPPPQQSRSDDSPRGGDPSAYSGRDRGGRDNGGGESSEDRRARWERLRERFGR